MKIEYRVALRELEAVLKNQRLKLFQWLERGWDDRQQIQGIKVSRSKLFPEAEFEKTN